jgi:predicted hotdog family 3-hydroxylacyl-ACP dehydratase
MVWVDEVLRANEEGGECRVSVRPDSLYWEGDHIHPTACIEWVAQSFAYVRSCNLMEAGRQGQPKAHETLLVGIKNAEFMFEVGDWEVDHASEIFIKVDRFREFGPIIMVRGEVRLPSGRVLMTGSLRVYHGF